MSVSVCGGCASSSLICVVFCGGGFCSTPCTLMRQVCGVSAQELAGRFKRSVQKQTQHAVL